MSYTGDEQRRSNRTNYSLRNVPRRDYSRQLRGPPTSRSSTIVITNQETDMEQLAAALTELTRFQQEQQRQLEESQRQQEERRQQEEELRRQQEECRQQEEELRRQQNEMHQEQVRIMHEQHVEQMEAMSAALKADRDSTSAVHLKIAPYQEKEDIQDLLEAFEGIMKIQKVKETDWVLRLTPLLNGKARTVCTNFGPSTNYKGVKEAILDHHNINLERCQRQFRALTWTKDQEPAEWITNGMKLLNRWLLPDEGVDKVVDKIAVEQFINGLPQELRIWVASHKPDKPANIAELIESYDSAHARTNVEKTKFHPTSRPTTTRDLSNQWRRNRGISQASKERKPLSEMVCFKCNKKGHLARNCTEKTLHVQEECEKIRFFGEGEVNGRPVQKIQIDSGASRTVIDRSLVSQKDIGEESIKVTFGNGASGEYPLATVKVKFDGEEYDVKAAVVQDLAEEVLLGRDVPLHKHIVKRLPKREQMELLQQLANTNHIRIEEVAVEETALQVMTQAQKKKLDQGINNETQEEDEMQLEAGDAEEDETEEERTQDEDKETPEETETILEEFQFDDDMFGQSKSKIRTTRAERRELNVRWNQMKDISNNMQLKSEQEKDPDIQKWIQQEDPTRIK